MGIGNNQQPKARGDQHDKVNDPIHMLQWFRKTMSRMNEQMLQLTANDEYESFTHELELIEQYQELIAEYLLEESYAELATYERSTNTVTLQYAPENLRLIPTTQGVTISGIPIWMMGHKSHKRLPPIYHRDRPMIRKIPMWHAMIHQLKSTYLASVWKDSSTLPDKPSSYAHIVFHFHTDHLQVRDLDHYDVAPIINACVSNGLLLSDHPSRLSFSMIWEEDTEQPRLDLHVRYLEQSVALPMDLDAILGMDREKFSRSTGEIQR
ncbi:hypothetical protein LLE49_23415 [Alicyclobacillus tolerans]|uniref:hypothetical protein n=1 Tax=Alicyclobacillus tolerans TaxID=90970 RepID=UPI001F38E287|nr:hypothetical protein [Alicyclobacillus tolerans]MCF8567673.1 hypothetical protein [Alicyclobacillus tolerans]